MELHSFRVFFLKVNTILFTPLLNRISIIQNHQQHSPWPSDVCLWEESGCVMNYSFLWADPYLLRWLCLCVPLSYNVCNLVFHQIICLLYWLEVNWIEQFWPASHQFYINVPVLNSCVYLQSGIFRSRVTGWGPWTEAVHLFRLSLSYCVSASDLGHAASWPSFGHGHDSNCIDMSVSSNGCRRTAILPQSTVVLQCEFCFLLSESSCRDRTNRLALVHTKTVPILDFLWGNTLMLHST